MKNLIHLLVFILITITARTQMPANQQHFKTDLATVVSDFRENFQHIIGKELVGEPQSTEYECRLPIRDALSSSITRYSAAHRNIYSWQAVIMVTEDFYAAEKKFRSFFDQINHIIIRNGDRQAEFSAPYQAPAEEIKFTSIVFETRDREGAPGKLKIELLMQAGIIDWTIRVLVYEKEREDNERGPLID